MTTLPVRDTSYSASHIQAVQQALKALTARIEEAPFEFRLPDGTSREFPTDDDFPLDSEFESYVVKEMEFAETSLVASRLQKELELPVAPLTFAVDDHIQAILLCVGREAHDVRIDPLKYYPLPHLQVNPEIPFIDFAGFLVVLLSDYILWSGSPKAAPTMSARAEIDTATRFLVDSHTYIEDDNGIGWGFIPSDKCRTRFFTKPQQREALPTAWALTALQKYLALPDPAEDIKKKAIEILPRVFEWIGSLRREEGLFAATERPSKVNLAGHNYVTESLLTLAELAVKGVDDVAVEAIERYLDELDRPEALADFEINISYPVDLRARVNYSDRTTWANCLATLALGVDHLKQVRGPDELIGRARVHCASMARHILMERRNERGLWQRSALQFHWTLAAVEALLRVSLFAQTRRYLTTDDALTQAVDLVLGDPAFRKAFREAFLDSVQKSSKPYDVPEDGSDLEASERGE